MANAGEIFPKIAAILKEKAKHDCKCTDRIEEMCQKYSNLLQLWDGAFSLASKEDPTDEDIAVYERFAMAAVYSHKAIGCNITHKVHLMWRHVAIQMKTHKGIGNKREDWLEHQHQVTRVKREQYHRTTNQETRVNAMAKSIHQETDPQSVAYKNEADAGAKRGPRKNYVTREQLRKQKRELGRSKALEEWEAAFIWM